MHVGVIEGGAWWIVLSLFEDWNIRVLAVTTVGGEA